MKRILLLTLTLFTLSCSSSCPTCLKGHDVMIHHEGYHYTNYITMPVGDINISIPTDEYQPPWEETRFICDQYELERMPK